MIHVLDENCLGDVLVFQLSHDVSLDSTSELFNYTVYYYHDVVELLFHTLRLKTSNVVCLVLIIFSYFFPE